ncbi:MAG TPA: hypothetical protein VI279_03460 [Rhodocyclaceae bacterium]
MNRQSHGSTCKGCVHFFVTYDTSFPYGCRILGFKSRRYPYLEVEASSGQPCEARTLRPPRSGERGE